VLLFALALLGVGVGLNRPAGGLAPSD
jgi:hypothetical protein